jgi:hypothetical protein
MLKYQIFVKKIFFIVLLLGEVQFFRVVFRLRGTQKKFELGQKIFPPFLNPLYVPILVFPKFDPLTASGMALCFYLRPKCQNLFSLV